MKDKFNWSFQSSTTLKSPLISSLPADYSNLSLPERIAGGFRAYGSSVIENKNDRFTKTAIRWTPLTKRSAKPLASFMTSYILLVKYACVH